MQQLKTYIMKRIVSTAIMGIAIGGSIEKIINGNNVPLQIATIVVAVIFIPIINYKPEKY